MSVVSVGKSPSPLPSALLTLALILTGLVGAVPTQADPASPLTITQTASPSPATSGSELTYSITVKNTAGAQVTNANFTDQLNGVGGIGTPPQLVLTSSAGSCTQSSVKVSCSLGTIAGGASVTVTIRGLVNAAAGTTLNNTVSVTATKSAQNFTTSSTIATLVQGTIGGGGGGGGSLPDLTISKSGPSSVVVSAPFDYVLTVNNPGAAAASNVKVVDTLPTGVVLSSFDTTSLFTCTSTGTPTTVTCLGGSVNAGANASITLHVVAPASATSLANTASVDPGNTIAESNENNNTSATVSTSVTSAPAPQGLTVTNTDAPDPVMPGGTLTYTIVVKNISTTRADDVVTVDGTQGLDASSITASQAIANGTIGTTGGCVVSAPQVVCSLRSLNPGGTQTITIKGQVTLAAGAKIVNTATATANVKNVGVKASASTQTVVKPAVDLSITKSDSPDPVCASSWPNVTHLTSPPDGLAAAGGTVPTLLAAPGCLGGLTYTMTVGNSGIQTASNVTVRDPMPAGLVFDSYSSDAGFICSVDAAGVVTCTGGTIPQESTRTLTLLLAAPATVGDISNTVTVDPNNAIYEADETNNTFTAATKVGTGIDLVVRKDDHPIDPAGAQNVTAGFDPIATSGTETYTVTVDNVGTQDATGIRVRDTLPAGTRFRSVVSDATHGFTCSQDGSATGGIVECVGGHLLGTNAEFYDPAGPPPAGPGDDFATITITVFAMPTVGTMHNEVRVDPNNEIAEYNETNNVYTEDTTVTTGGAPLGAFNELTIAKTQTAPAANVVSTSSVVEYDLVVSNVGTDPAVNVVLRDTLPAGFSYIVAADTALDAQAFTCSANASNVITCSGATLSGTVLAQSGAPQQRTVHVKAFASAIPGNYTNTAVVDPGNLIPEGDETNNNASAPTKVTIGAGFIDLGIAKTGPAQVRPGAPINYVITATNNGTDPAFNVVVRDDLPAGSTFVSASDTIFDIPFADTSGAFTCGLQGTSVVCSGGTLDGSADLLGSLLPTTRTIRVQVMAPTNVAALSADLTDVHVDLVNNAFIDPSNAIGESNETNNAASAQTTVKPGLNLTIKKTGPSSASQNTEQDYNITVTNSGPDNAYGVKVVDTLPVGLIPLSIDAGTDFRCSVSENPVNVVTCIGDLPTGDTKIKVHVFVTAKSGDLDNEACVDPDATIAETNERDNCAHSITTATPPKPDLSINKSASAAVVTEGQGLDYTLTVSNVGSGASTGPITVTDPLPAGVTLVNASGTNAFDCTASAGQDVSCAGPSLDAGQSALITVHTTVNAGAAGSFTNTATVSTDGDETITDNNTAKVTTSVGGSGIDLIVTPITDAPDPVNLSNGLTYTIVVTNAGSAIAGTVADPAQVKIDLPQNGTTFVAAAGTNGVGCGTPSGATLLCTGVFPGGGSTTITVSLTVDPGAPPTLTLRATADPANQFVETNEGNNSQTAVTTVTGSLCTSTPCIDLVAAMLLGSPDPVKEGATATFTTSVVNVGNTTTVNGGSDNVKVNIYVGGSAAPTAMTAPSGFTCALDGSTPPGSFVEWWICKGNLAAGAGATFTTTATAPTAGGFLAASTYVELDTAALVPEFTTSNNAADYLENVTS